MKNVKKIASEILNRRITGYNVIDTQTKQVKKEYKGSTKGRVARGYAEKLNQQYGSYRYTVQIIFENN